MTSGAVEPNPSDHELARVLRVENYAAEIAMAARFWDDWLLARHQFRRDLIRLADGVGEVFDLHRPVTTGGTTWCLACSRGRHRKITYPCGTAAAMAMRVQTTAIHDPDLPAPEHLRPAAAARGWRDHMNLVLPYRVQIETR